MTPEIHIDRIQLNLRGVSPEVARTAANALSPAMQQAIAAQLATRTANSNTQVDHIAMPALHVPAGVDANMIRDAVARQVATAIAAQVPAKRP